ncbi:helix-turn-helix domain-containing protein [Tenacibaculum sp. Mcav3-52]|uniref:helix-turn-helix domain-containing protein n=1 Tax=Tenacibaculum sp. Mcav3-52 TaxID=2917762 RepID=UPI001EF3182B|nr:AraC family transcriptional regulator [Tenacibaculum sp. Mcav3-52]
MNLDSYLIPIIYLLGLIQGIIFSILLIYLDKKNNRPTLLLGLFIFAYSINYLKPIAKLLDLDKDYSFLNNLPVDFTWLLFPLFYVYIRNISILPKSNKVYFYLLPGLLMLIIDILVYLNLSSGLEQLKLSKEFRFVNHIGGHLYDIFIYYKTYTFIKKHTEETNNQYTSTTGKELQWAKTFMSIGLFFTLTLHFLPEITNKTLNLFIILIDVGLLYWISIYGLQQQTIKNLTQQKDSKIEKKNNFNSENKISKVDTDLFNHIQQTIILHKKYKDPDLTIADVANITNQHPKRISFVINEISNKNFKTFINGFRVNEAIEILKSNNSKNYSIEGISLEVGFKSKSAFYSAFKKETGTTPTNYKNSFF